jgi:hypothetical protein
MRGRRVLSVVALVAVALLVGAVSAGADSAPAITVTPSVGLTDGQVVQVTGTGFSPNPTTGDWFITECTPRILTVQITIDAALNFCDVNSNGVGAFLPTGANGNISGSYTVHDRFFTTANAEVFCTDEPNACAILVSQVTNAGFVAAAAPIDFTQHVAHTRADCLNGGWKSHTDDHGQPFKSLGACVSFVSRPH